MNERLMPMLRFLFAQGQISKLYAMTLSVLDEAVGAIKNALVDKGMMDNTLLVFT
jgi:arylsulfatase A-like enzyme